MLFNAFLESAAREMRYADMREEAKSARLRRRLHARRQARSNHLLYSLGDILIALGLRLKAPRRAANASWVAAAGEPTETASRINLD